VTHLDGDLAAPVRSKMYPGPDGKAQSHQSYNGAYQFDGQFPLERCIKIRGQMQTGLIKISKNLRTVKISLDNPDSLDSRRAISEGVRIAEMSQ
jgi:hypothetical protein